MMTAWGWAVWSALVATGVVVGLGALLVEIPLLEAIILQAMEVEQEVQGGRFGRYVMSPANISIALSAYWGQTWFCSNRP